jgi:hypothetical protein
MYVGKKPSRTRHLWIYYTYLHKSSRAAGVAVRIGQAVELRSAVVPMQLVHLELVSYSNHEDDSDEPADPREDHPASRSTRIRQPTPSSVAAAPSRAMALSHDMAPTRCTPGAHSRDTQIHTHSTRHSADRRSTFVSPLAKRVTGAYRSCPRCASQAHRVTGNVLARCRGAVNICGREPMGPPRAWCMGTQRKAMMSMHVVERLREARERLVCGGGAASQAWRWPHLRRGFRRASPGEPGPLLLRVPSSGGGCHARSIQDGDWMFRVMARSLPYRAVRLAALQTAGRDFASEGHSFFSSFFLSFCPYLRCAASEVGCCVWRKKQQGTAWRVALPWVWAAATSSSWSRSTPLR